jgi:hypothetical protein
MIKIRFFRKVVIGPWRVVTSSTFLLPFLFWKIQAVSKSIEAKENTKYNFRLFLFLYAVHDKNIGNLYNR